jgi:two-component system, sensor histidine kinase PdtaS
MFVKTQSATLPMLVEELQASMPQVAELLGQLAAEPTLERRRMYLRQLGGLWYRLDGEPEVLAELGIALADRLAIEPGVALAELLMSYGAAREETRTRELGN